MNIFLAKNTLTVQCKMGFSMGAMGVSQEPARSTIVSLTSDDVSRFCRANSEVSQQCPKEVKYWLLYVMLYTTTVYDPFHLYIIYIYISLHGYY